MRQAFIVLSVKSELAHGTGEPKMLIHVSFEYNIYVTLLAINKKLLKLINYLNSKINIQLQ